MLTRKKLAAFLFCTLNEPFRSFFCFMSLSRSRIFTPNGQFIIFASGETMYFVEPTPYQTVRVVPSTNSIMIHPVFDSRRCSFFVGFSALWDPPKSVTELAVNTDLIQDCNLCSPVPPSVLQDVMDVSTITIPPLTSTVGSISDSIEHREFAAPLRKANVLDHLEEQLEVRSIQLDRQQERLAHMTTRVNRLLLENDTFRRDLCNTKSHLEDMQRTSKIGADNSRALSMLFKILSSFTESSDRLTGEDSYLQFTY